jgi:hypothetical protein
MKFKVLMLQILFAIQKYKDQDTQIYNFAIVLYGYETWSLALAEGVSE